MITVLNISTGYTNCDICGEGQGIMTILVSDQGERYKFIASHPCHGGAEVDGLTRPRLLETVAEWSRIVRTRVARNQIRRTLARIEAGYWDPATRPRAVRNAEPPRSPHAPPAPTLLQPAASPSPRVSWWSPDAARSILAVDWNWAANDEREDGLTWTLRA